MKVTYHPPCKALEPSSLMEIRKNLRNQCLMLQLRQREQSLLNKQLVGLVFAGADNFDTFVVFVESIVGKGFISLLDTLMQKVIIDILHRAGDSSEWASGYTLPGTILQRATDALVNLSDIQSKSDAANFLAGESHCPLIECGVLVRQIFH